MALDELEIGRIASRVVELLHGEQPAPHLLTTEQAAAGLGVSTDWLRENADRLGALRLGTGPRARLRFDADQIAAALSTRQDGRGSDAQDRPQRRRSRRRTASGAPLLPIVRPGSAR